MAWTRREALVGSAIAGLSGLLLYRIIPYFRVYQVEVGDRAPGFTLTKDDGSGVSLADFRGKYVLLNFWATWCPPCVDELPSLVELHNLLSGKGLVVLGVSVDHNEDDYRRFLEQWKVTFPTVRDPEMAVATRYGTHKYPESYLIDPEGMVRRKYVGPEDWTNPEILNYLRSLL